MYFQTKGNYELIDDYKGKLYHLSEKDLDGWTMVPKVPINYFTQNGYEDSKTKRISFAPTIRQCILGLSANLTGKTFNVYSPIDTNIKVYKPNKDAVPDVSITHELWVLKSVKLKKVGEIKITKASKNDGYEFTYGDNTAKLYDFDFDIIQSPEYEKLVSR